MSCGCLLCVLILVYVLWLFILYVDSGICLLVYCVCRFWYMSCGCLFCVLILVYVLWLFIVYVDSGICLVVVYFVC